MRNSHKLYDVDGRDKSGHDESVDGGALAEASVLKTTRIDDVVGMLAYNRIAKTIEEMDASVLLEASRRKVLGEY